MTFDPLDQRPAGDVVLTDPDGNPVTIGGNTVREQQAGIAAAQARWATRRTRQDRLDAATQAINAITDGNWDFLDAYTNIVIPGQQGTPGSEWPQFAVEPAPTTVAEGLQQTNRRVGVLTDRVAILRTQAVRSAWNEIRVAKALSLIIAALESVIDKDDSIVPPPAR